MKRLMVISLLIVVLDQLFKQSISICLELGESISIINDFFSITYVHNEGAAWSLFTGNRVFLIGMTLFFLGLIYYFFIKDKNLKQIEKILYSALIGGILGNLLDRIVRGFVIDFLSFHILGYNFPIFNIADIFIVCTVIGIFLFTLKEDIYERNHHRQTR